MTPPRRQVEIALGRAQALDEAGAFEDARFWFDRAEEAADGDAALHMALVNDRARSAYRRQQTAAALRDTARLEALALRYGRALSGCELDTVACVALAAGETERALEAARASVRTTPGQQVVELAEHLVTLAAAARGTGGADEADEAVAALDRADDLLRQAASAPTRSRLLHERAELHAARGDLEAALLTYRQLHALDRNQTPTRRAPTPDDALRDPLTGLRNRLYVDETLDRRLASCAAHRRVLVAAVVDVDLLAADGEPLLHPVREAVLRRVARQLERTADEVGAESYAARLGGEELAVVLVTDDADAAVAEVEALRRRVEGLDWSDLTPGRTVTLSAGVAVAGPESVHGTLLAAADERLALARLGGRNQVCGP